MTRNQRTNLAGDQTLPNIGEEHSVLELSVSCWLPAESFVKMGLSFSHMFFLFLMLTPDETVFGVYPLQCDSVSLRNSGLPTKATRI